MATIEITVEKFGKDNYEIIAVGPKRTHRKDGLALKRAQEIVDRLVQDGERRGHDVTVEWI